MFPQALNSTFYKQFKYSVRDMNILSNVTAKIIKEFNSSLAYQPAAGVRALLTKHSIIKTLSRA